MTAASTPHTNPWPTPSAVDWLACPKVSLHEHIDGSLRPHTLWELCQTQGIPLPCPSADDVGDWMLTNAAVGARLAVALHANRSSA